MGSGVGGVLWLRMVLGLIDALWVLWFPDHGCGKPKGPKPFLGPANASASKAS